MIYKTIDNYLDASKDFLENEKQFHLGVIPTEQSNPKTKNLSATIMRSTEEGVKCILSADEDIAKVALKQFKTKEFQAFVTSLLLFPYRAVVRSKSLELQPEKVSCLLTVLLLIVAPWLLLSICIVKVLLGLETITI